MVLNSNRISTTSMSAFEVYSIRRHIANPALEGVFHGFIDSLLQRLTYQGKSTTQMSLSIERLCRCYDGDFWYVLKGTKGKRVGVTSDSPPCFYHSSAVPRVSLAKNCGFKKWVGRENAFLLSKKIRRSRRKL